MRDFEFVIGLCFFALLWALLRAFFILLRPVFLKVLRAIQRRCLTRALRRGVMHERWRGRPEEAASQLGEGVIDLWRTHVEPKYRSGPRERPIDWQWRRFVVLRRDNHCCARCLVAAESLHVHHRRPVRAGGAHDLSNLCALCASCHSKVHADLRREPCDGLNPRTDLFAP